MGSADLTDLIDEFLTKYPPHVELTWARPQPKPKTATAEAIRVIATDLATASEKHDRATRAKEDT